MRRIGIVGIFAMLVLGMTAGAWAQAPADKAAAPAPTVDEILDRYVKALGGKEAIQKLTSRVARGDFEIPDQGAAGSVEIFSKAPNKRGLTITIDGFGEIKQAFNGTIAWADNPQAGYRELSGAELENQKRNSDFYQALRFKELFAKLTAGGIQKAGDRDAWLLEADTGSGKPQKYFFDAETHLLIRVETERESPMGGTMTIQTFLDDYKVYDGVKVATTIRQVNPQFTSIMRLKEVQHNVAVDDVRFDKP